MNVSAFKNFGSSAPAQRACAFVVVVALLLLAFSSFSRRIPKSDQEAFLRPQVARSGRTQVPPPPAELKQRTADLQKYTCKFTQDSIAPATREHPQPVALVSLFSSSDKNVYKSYVLGLEVLGTSLGKHAPSSVQRIVMILEGTACEAQCVQRLHDVGWKVCVAPKVTPPHPSNQARFRDQFVKLVMWNMVQFERVVYLDSDTLAVGRLDRLLASKVDAQHPMAVAQDISGGRWVDGFNMGVAVIRTNATEFLRLYDLMRGGSVRYNEIMSEQGFLSEVYKGVWTPLKFEDNANLAAFTDDRNKWNEKEADIRLIHFTMEKGWNTHPGTAYYPVGKRWIDAKSVLCLRRCAAAALCSLAKAAGCECKTVDSNKCGGT